VGLWKSVIKSCNVHVSTTSFSVLTILGLVHVKFNNKLFDILMFQQSGVVVFFPFLFLVSSRTLSHMTLSISFSRPTEIHPETWENCYCVFPCSFSPTNPAYIPFILPPKNPRQSWLKFVPGKGCAGHKFCHLSPFAKLPTNQGRRISVNKI